MADVPTSRDPTDLAFGEPTSTTSGAIRFTRRPVAECPNVQSDVEFEAATKATLGPRSGPSRRGARRCRSASAARTDWLRLATTAARDAFVTSASRIIDTRGPDGLAIDFEGHRLPLNAETPTSRTRPHRSWST